MRPDGPKQTPTPAEPADPASEDLGPREPTPEAEGSVKGGGAVQVKMPPQWVFGTELPK